MVKHGEVVPRKRGKLKTDELDLGKLITSGKTLFG